MVTGYSSYKTEIKNVKFIADDGRTCKQTAIVTFLGHDGEEIGSELFGVIEASEIFEMIKEGKDLIFDNFFINDFSLSAYRRHNELDKKDFVQLKKFSAQANRDLRGFTADAIERLTNFDWPGNIRQLQNEVQRAVLLSEGVEVALSDLSVSATRSATGAVEESDSGFTLLESVEKNTIIQTLKEANGNKLETAKRLGIGRQTLYNKIKAYGIDP